MSRLSCRALTFCVILAVAPAPLRGQATIPNTPAGQALRAFLDAFNSPDSTRVAAFLSTYQVGFPFRNLFNFRQMTGGFNLLRVEVSEPRHIEFVMRHRSDPMTGYGTLDVAADDPKHINGTGFPLGPNVSPDSIRVDARTRARVVRRLAALLDSVYVSPEVGKQMSDSLRARLSRGAYDRHPTGPSLAIRLNTDLEQIAHDKHMQIAYRARARPDAGFGQDSPPPSPEELAQQRRALDETNCGFRSVEQLEGNVGYLRLDAFEDPALCESTLAAAMTFVGGTQALIVDLRENGGGQAAMVVSLASYLFDRRTHLNDRWTRVTGNTQSFWTRDSVGGRRFGGDKPVYVLTSAHTFSAAEEFAYDLQALKRGTIVGETTAGGAHPTSEATIDDHFAITLPWGKPINPITGTDWEGVGVVPDVKASADEALAAALKLIRDRAPHQ